MINRNSPSTLETLSSGRDGQLESIDGVEGYHRILSPIPSRKNVRLDANGFVDKVINILSFLSKRTIPGDG